MGVGILHGFIPGITSAFPLRANNGKLKRLWLSHLYEMSFQYKFHSTIAIANVDVHLPTVEHRIDTFSFKISGAKLTWKFFNGIYANT